MISDIDILFSRELLKQGHALVKKHAPEINLRKDAWVWSGGLRDRCWEFHGPDRFYWYGTAGNAYEARYKGWMAWMEKNHPEAMEVES